LNDQRKSAIRWFYLCLNWSTETLIYLCHNLHGICGVGTDIWIKCNDISPYGGFTLIVNLLFTCLCYCYLL
jgi:hypothetical protein